MNNRTFYNTFIVCNLISIVAAIGIAIYLFTKELGVFYNIFIIIGFVIIEAYLITILVESVKKHNRPF